MKIYKTKMFMKWQKKEKISDEVLCTAINEVKSGLVDANLGSNLFKKRVAKPGTGKRGSYRTIIASKFNNMWFYIFGFSKNEKDNITEREKIVLTEVAAHLLSLSAAEREKLVLENKLYEVNYESK
jgi:hypothetical protein